MRIPLFLGVSCIDLFLRFLQCGGAFADEADTLFIVLERCLQGKRRFRVVHDGDDGVNLIEFLVQKCCLSCARLLFNYMGGEGAVRQVGF